MTPNELLLWLSARKEGSWSQFRGAVERLDLADTDEEEGDTSLPLHQRVRFNLERLGHLEFGTAESESAWRVVPPTLAIFQSDTSATAVLCGARTPKLLKSFAKGSNGLCFEQASHTDCPDIVRIHGTAAESLREFAQREEILSQLDTPTVLLSHLPRIDAIKAWRREPLPQMGKDWDVKEFIIERKMMKWRATTLQDANASSAQGLFCFTRFQMPQYFLREGKETIRLPGAIGKYYILFRRRRSVLRYDRKQRLLTLPAIARPPLLTERGLILCSGFPPAISVTYGRRMLTYRDIPEEVVGITAESLRQDLL
jgi:hypothetical protein